MAVLDSNSLAEISPQTDPLLADFAAFMRAAHSKGCSIPLANQYLDYVKSVLVHKGLEVTPKVLHEELDMRADLHAANFFAKAGLEHTGNLCAKRSGLKNWFISRFLHPGGVNDTTLELEDVRSLTPATPSKAAYIKALQEKVAAGQYSPLMARSCRNLCLQFVEHIWNGLRAEASKDFLTAVDRLEQEITSPTLNYVHEFLAAHKKTIDSTRWFLRSFYAVLSENNLSTFNPGRLGDSRVISPYAIRNIGDTPFVPLFDAWCSELSRRVLGGELEKGTAAMYARAVHGVIVTQAPKAAGKAAGNPMQASLTLHDHILNLSERRATKAIAGRKLQGRGAYVTNWVFKNVFQPWAKETFSGVKDPIKKALKLNDWTEDALKQFRMEVSIKDGPQYFVVRVKKGDKATATTDKIKVSPPATSNDWAIDKPKSQRSKVEPTTFVEHSRSTSKDSNKKTSERIIGKIAAAKTAIGEPTIPQQTPAKLKRPRQPVHWRSITAFIKEFPLKKPNPPLRLVLEEIAKEVERQCSNQEPTSSKALARIVANIARDNRVLKHKNQFESLLKLFSRSTPEFEGRALWTATMRKAYQIAISPVEIASQGQGSAEDHTT